ncbi:MAG: hypothetical protein LBU27_07385 [Candidatus Peribacteria bacterium]|jgi:hypothetical protein|nr:hypothetical protein [Candidatus Peribacteria bacterium]
MIEEIKKLIYAKFPAEESRGVFFSLFDEKGALIESHGVLETDKPLDALIDLLYTGIIKKMELQVKNAVFDVVQSLTPQNDVATFLRLSPKEYGILLTSMVDGKTGVLLPDTKGIETMQQALASIKQKYQLSGNVAISTFQTERIVWSK